MPATLRGYSERGMVNALCNRKICSSPPSGNLDRNRNIAAQRYAEGYCELVGGMLADPRSRQHVADHKHDHLLADQRNLSVRKPRR